jgi:hypothetical protein
MKQVKLDAGPIEYQDTGREGPPRHLGDFIAARSARSRVP